MEEMPSIPLAGPAFGEVSEIAPGLLWSRLPLPYPPMEVNVYLLEGHDGWTVVDVGMNADETRAAWEALLAGPMKGLRFSRILLTHHHPDHLGLADWLSHRLGVGAWITPAARDALLADTRLYDEAEAEAIDRFCAAHELGGDVARVLKRQPNAFAKRVAVTPQALSILPLQTAIEFRAGRFDLNIGEGHAPGQLMMRDRAGRFFLSADQVLPDISPMLAFSPLHPFDDVVSRYLDSLDEIESWVDEDALVLPGHFAPFRGLRARLAEIRLRQSRRGERIMNACRAGEVTIGGLLGVLSGRTPTPLETAFAVSETLTNVNRLVAEERLRWRNAGGRMTLLAADPINCT